MKISKLLIVTVIIATIAMTTTAFASGADEAAGTINYGAACLRGIGNFKCRGGFMGYGNYTVNQDPIDRLKDIKANLQTLVDSGRITQDQSKLEASRIDERIKEIEEFSKLTLEQKKEKVIADLKSALDTEVKNENLTQKRADEILESYKQRVSGLNEIPCPMSGILGGKLGGFRANMGGFGRRGFRN